MGMSKVTQCLKSRLPVVIPVLGRMDEAGEHTYFIYKSVWGYILKTYKANQTPRILSVVQISETWQQDVILRVDKVT